MTLILTYLLPFGIVMGADSAVTYRNQYIIDSSGRRRPRILTGARKVYEVPKIRAGVSFWGEMNIGDRTADQWISELIPSREDDYDTIHDFARKIIVSRSASIIYLILYIIGFASFALHFLS